MRFTRQSARRLVLIFAKAADLLEEGLACSQTTGEADVRRALGACLVAACLVAGLAAPGAWADPSGAGVLRWMSGYDMGNMAYSDQVTITPDGSKVAVTGASSDAGQDPHGATVVYDARSGQQQWSD